MADNEISASGDLVFKPCARAFFVYYVAMAIVFLGPRINPEAGLPVWLGTLLGVIIVVAVIYLKYGQEYHISARGVARVWRWPAPRQHEITWENLEDVRVLRGFTQSLLHVGNLAIKDKSGGAALFWFGLSNPTGIKDLIYRKRP